MVFTAGEVAGLVPEASNVFVAIAPGIYVLRAFSPAEAAAAITLAADSPMWQSAMTYAGAQADDAIRNAEVLYEELHPPHAALYRDRLGIVAGKLAATVDADTALTEMQLVRYHPGGHYAAHRDVPNVGKLRKLSLVCYLNDDLEGGETTLIDGNVTVAPAAGTVLAFPPELLHRAEPVRSGVKYVITTWFGIENPAQSEA